MTLFSSRSGRRQRTTQFSFCLEPVIHVVSVAPATFLVELVGATGDVAIADARRRLHTRHRDESVGLPSLCLCHRGSPVIRACPCVSLTKLPRFPLTLQRFALLPQLCVRATVPALWRLTAFRSIWACQGGLYLFRAC